MQPAFDLCNKADETRQLLISMSANPNCNHHQIKTDAESSRHLLIFSAPGGSAFDDSLAASMRANIEASGRECSVFYHHTPALTSHDVLSSFMTALKNEQSIRPSIFIASHGIVRGEQHLINLNGQYTPTSELFNRISENCSRPVDIFMIACHGGAALASANNLPRGSSVAVLAPGNLEVGGKAVNMLTKNVGKSESLSAKHILLTYCTTLVSRFPPSLWQDGCEYKLDKMMQNRQGRKFSENEKQQAHKRLNDLLSASRIDEIIGKIEAARDEWSIAAVDYGPALAVTGAIDLPR